MEGTRSASRTRGKYEGCDGWAWAQGYCDPHYQRLKHEGVIQVQRIFNDPVKRFESEFDKNPDNGCWEWRKVSHPRGYRASRLPRMAGRPDLTRQEIADDLTTGGLYSAGSAGRGALPEPGSGSNGKRCGRTTIKSRPESESASSRSTEHERAATKWARHRFCT